MALGIVGPKGDPGAPGEARAYACTDVSFDGTLVAPCVGRPSKNVVSIVANPLASTVTSVNVIVNVIGTDDQVGCPANSVVVRTGRYRQADTTGTSMLLESARLAVNLAVM